MKKAVFNATILLAVLANPESNGEAKPQLAILDEAAITQYSQTVPRSKVSVPCKVEGTTHRCMTAPPPDGCGKLRYVPPLPASDVTERPCETVSPVFVWAKPLDVSDGERRLATLLREADTPLPACPEGCWTTFHTNAIRRKSSDVDGKVEGLARCRIRTHGTQWGAPESCEIAAIYDGATWRLRALSGYDETTGFGGLPDFDLSFYATSTVNVESILSAVRAKLELRPLLLTTDPGRVVAPLPRAAQTVLGVGSPQWSAPLGEWTWANVRIDRYAPPQPNLAFAPQSPYRLHSEFLVTVDLFVNRYNTTPAKDWHRPTETEIRAYVEDVKVALGGALKQQCSTARWVDNRTLLCQTAR